MSPRTFPAESQNVIGAALGSHRPDQVIVVSAHYDNVPGNVGANDDASGIVLVLELARLFARRRPRRTVRFIAYESEENLSLGAYLHMRSLTPRQRRQCVLALQAGPIGGYIGQDIMRAMGPGSLLEHARKCWRRRRHAMTPLLEVSPFSDHFPLAIAGVPTIHLGRRDVMGEGMWQHHSPHDTLENVSVDVVHRTLETTAKFVRSIANATRLPYVPRIQGGMMKEVRHVGRSLYRHPWSADQFRYANPTSE